ncbi:MAG: twin-arginine translocase TatA/TatE family subunit [Caldilineaceae bacterium]
MFDIGAPELLIILVIVAMLFGVGRLPEVFGAVGKGIREFRKEAEGPNEAKTSDVKTTPASVTSGDHQ